MFKKIISIGALGFVLSACQTTSNNLENVITLDNNQKGQHTYIRMTINNRF